MKSHTIPQRLLKQFAYFDPITNSLRLWKYTKGRRPDPKASPKTAARIDGYFADPDDSTTEGIIEKKLADEIEDPVHKFIGKFDDPSWAMTPTQQEQMARYVSLLFNRSEARKAGSEYLLSIMKDVVGRFLSDESRVLTVAGHWSIQAHFRGQRLLVTPDHIRASARAVIERDGTQKSHQSSYAQFITALLTGGPSAKAYELMVRGEWRVIRTDRDKPFILSDTPVVTWERLIGQFNLGIGFERPNVEVILPISPTACLQILPAVKRTRSIVAPTVAEVNTIQAGFAYTSCFADRESDEINQTVQDNIGKLKIGVNVFTLRDRNFDDLFYDIMMNQG